MERYPSPWHLFRNTKNMVPETTPIMEGNHLSKCQQAKTQDRNTAPY